MTAATVGLDAIRLGADGALSLGINCPHCGGGMVLEASSRGRTPNGPACPRVSASLYCEKCRARYVLVCELGLAGGSPFRDKGPDVKKPRGGRQDAGTN